VRCIIVFSAVVGVAALGGCGDIREVAGVKKTAPDEFAVVRRAPLDMPPNFDLRPPRPGEPARAELNPRTSTQAALLTGPTATRPQAESQGEEALLQALRIGNVDPSIRTTVDRESSILGADQRNFVERLMFWRTWPLPGVVIDAPEERRRIQENDALGRPVTEGETPSIERKSDGSIGVF